MGKIFDAIEKSTKTREHNNNVVVRDAKRSKTKTQEPNKKVVVQDEKRLKANNKIVQINNELPRKTSCKLDPLLVTYHEPGSLEAETFKVLKTNILFPKEGKTPRTILVTSTSPNEGKTFVSANLAISIALGVEEHVLLVDGDLRRSSIQERFGYKKAAGLSEYLTSKMPLQQFFLKTPIEKLSILGGGRMPLNPTELLSSKKMSDLILEIKNRYNDRYIIIDSPPPAAAAETIALSKQVDGVLLVVKERGEQRKLVKETIEMIQRDKILGIVVNWSQRKLHKYYGYNKPSAAGGGRQC